jgi:hypothetical protein
MSLRLLIPALLAATLSAACAPEIGDSCATSTDCSVNGDRICDVAQPNGYCTIRDCEPNTCPDGSRCVEFRFAEERHATTWCMWGCEGDGDCRTGDGYACVTAAALGDGIARVADEGKADARFCSVPAPALTP